MTSPLSFRREFRYRARECLLEVDDLRPRRGDGDAHHLPVHVANPGQPAVPLIGWHKSGLHLQVLVRDAVDRFQAHGTPHQQYLGWMVDRVYRQRDLWIRVEHLDFRGVGGGAHHHLTSVPQEPPIGMARGVPSRATYANRAGIAPLNSRRATGPSSSLATSLRRIASGSPQVGRKPVFRLEENGDVLAEFSARVVEIGVDLIRGVGWLIRGVV